MCELRRVATRPVLPPVRPGSTRAHAPLGTLVKDLLGELFNFDTRLIRTLKHILVQPGRLTADYIAGRRANYVPPLRLFVFSSFLLFSLGGGAQHTSRSNRGLRI